MATRIVVHDRPLRRALDQLADDLDDLDDAHARTARTIRGRARELAPVASGELVRSIADERPDGSAVVTVSAGHGPPVHQGWTTTRGRRIAGRPFLDQAAADVLDDCVDFYVDAEQEHCDRAAARAPKGAR